MSNDKAPPRSIFGIGVRVRVRKGTYAFSGATGKTVERPDHWGVGGYPNAVVLDDSKLARPVGFDNDELEAI